MTTETKKPKGTLTHRCFCRMGVQEEIYRCADCDTFYARECGMPLTINGVTVGNYHKDGDFVSDALCPWCREDSAPWKNGRGA